jgi:hypothetical protein
MAGVYRSSLEKPRSVNLYKSNKWQANRIRDGVKISMTVVSGPRIEDS